MLNTQLLMRCVSAGGVTVGTEKVENEFLITVVILVVTTVKRCVLAKTLSLLTLFKKCLVPNSVAS